MYPSLSSIKGELPLLNFFPNAVDADVSMSLIHNSKQKREQAEARVDSDFSAFDVSRKVQMLIQNPPRILCKNCSCAESCPPLLSLAQQKNDDVMYQQ